ncbi:MAG: ATP-dependent DNA ligase [Methanobacteriota archaeon]
MLYRDLAAAYDQLEATEKRLEITRLVVDVLAKSAPDEVGPVVHLTQGRLHPDFSGIELGLAEKLIMKAVSKTTTVSEREIEKAYAETGDLGTAAERMMRRGQQATIVGFGEAKAPLGVLEVWRDLDEIARATGPGSQDLKLKLLHRLLDRAEPVEARYVVRTAAGKLRLGVADMTFLDALAAIATAGPGAPPRVVPVDELSEPERAERSDARARIEAAYNNYPDLGAVAAAVLSGGVAAAAGFALRLGVPVRAMLAERLTTPEEILSKMGGECIVEHKYDGLRLQAHVGERDVRFFTRRLEEVTPQFPDVAGALRKAFRGKTGILEGECVAIEPGSGEIRPFQEVTTRRGRKHGLEQAIREVPLAFVAFDLLLLDGDALLSRPLPERRAALERALAASSAVRLSEMARVRTAEELESFFERAVSEGAEGILAKSVAPDSGYRPGNRGWQWIKLKRDYRSELSDTLDLVVVGAFAGRGRRAGWYGALLLAAYDPETDRFATACKLGTGFTDEMLAALPSRLDAHKRTGPDPRVEIAREMSPDTHFSPAVVLEVVGAELTLSPTHTAGRGAVAPGSGLAVRFPRFTGRFRDDKSPEQATTAAELVAMYRRQRQPLARAATDEA